MTSSLSNLVDSLAEGIHKIKCIYGQDNQKCKTSGIEYKYCECSLGYTNVKDDLILYKLFCCNENYPPKKIDENLKKQLTNFVVAKKCLQIWIHGLLRYI